MHRTRSVLFSLLVLVVSLSTWSSAQSWSGVIATSRATDWSQVGVAGGIPTTWTRSGSAIPAGSSTATIQNALNACGTNHYVELGAGTFNLTSLSVPSNCELRGQGADQTFLVFSGSSSCHGFGGSIAMCSGDGTYAGGVSSASSWTAGYSQGTSTITLSSVAGITPNQTLIALDQCDDGYSGSSCSGSSADNSAMYICADAYASAGSGCGSEGGTNAYRPHRSQVQLVKATAISGNNVTISPAIIPPNYRSSQTPQAWVITPISNAGVRNLSIKPVSGDDGVLGFNGSNLWVQGVRIVSPGKAGIRMFETLHVSLVDNYIYGATDSDPYCFQIEVDTQSLIQNNIVQTCRSPIVYNGPSIGSVVAYNYTVNNWDGGSNFMWFQIWNHSSGTAFQLAEGNIGNGFANDDIHGSHNMITRFRNYYSGWEPGKTEQTNAIYEAAFSRYSNNIGNVLGRAGYHTVYTDSTGNSASAIQLGTGNGGTTPPVPADSLSGSTSMRWGNYDVVNGAVRWVSTEVPSALSKYPNTVPSSHSLPASFYMSSKPSWWGSAAWPAIGPDVAGGTVYGSNGGTTWAAQSVGGYANNIPALNCFKNTMNGPADGSGSVLSFNANTCYGSSSSTSTAPAAPTGLTATAQ